PAIAVPVRSVLPNAAVCDLRQGQDARSPNGVPGRKAAAGHSREKQYGGTAECGAAPGGNTWLAGMQEWLRGCPSGRIGWDPATRINGCMHLTNLTAGARLVRDAPLPP